MSVKFEIVFVNKDQRPFYIMARLTTPGQDFSIVEMPFLNGCRLKPEMTTPRALDQNGLPRHDLFVFFLADGNDISRLNKGTIAELTSSPAQF